MVTCAGVPIKEINPRTMESRLVSGLYFAGEIIDASAASGGYNLQQAFSTGYLAGESAANENSLPLWEGLGRGRVFLACARYPVLKHPRRLSG